MWVSGGYHHLRHLWVYPRDNYERQIDAPSLIRHWFILLLFFIHEIFLSWYTSARIIAIYQGLLSIQFPNQIEQEKFKFCLFFQLFLHCFLFALLIQLLDFKKPCPVQSGRGRGMYIFLDLKKMVFKNSSRGAGIDPPLRRANHSRFYDMNLTPATKPYMAAKLHSKTLQLLSLYTRWLLIR